MPLTTDELWEIAGRKSRPTDMNAVPCKLASVDFDEDTVTLLVPKAVALCVFRAGTVTVDFSRVVEEQHAAETREGA